jgi:hypothetical protein
MYPSFRNVLGNGGGGRAPGGSIAGSLCCGSGNGGGESTGAGFAQDAPAFCEFAGGMPLGHPKTPARVSGVCANRAESGGNWR